MTVILSQKIGNEGKTRTCSATCHTAKKDKCGCICGGKYHGMSRGGARKPESVDEAERLVKLKESATALAEILPKNVPPHDCEANAVPYTSDGALGHGLECGVCGKFLQAG